MDFTKLKLETFNSYQVIGSNKEFITLPLSKMSKKTPCSRIYSVCRNWWDELDRDLTNEPTVFGSFFLVIFQPRLIVKWLKI
jgi:hypothetical protein